MAFQPVTIKADDDGQRLDRWIKKFYPNISFGQAQKAIRKGEIRINGKRAKPESKLSTKDELRLPPYFYTSSKKAKPKSVAPKLKPNDIKYIRSLVVYEDQDIIVLNKPSGLATQGGTGIKKHIDGYLDGLKKKDDDPRPKLIHRLDKETSGLLVLGKTPDATRHLMGVFKTREVKKIYLAVSIPAPKEQQGEVRAGLIKGGGIYEKIYVDDDEGKSARTLFQVLDSAGKEAALVGLSPLTGRTHQLRVHMAEILESPIIGDGKYGFDKEKIENLPVKNLLHLHATYIRIPKPGKGKAFWEISVAPTAHFKQTLDYFDFTYDLESLDAWL